MCCNKLAWHDDWTTDTVNLYKFFGISDEYISVSCSDIEIKDQRSYNVFRNQNTFAGYELRKGNSSGNLIYSERSDESREKERENGKIEKTQFPQLKENIHKLLWKM